MNRPAPSPSSTRRPRWTWLPIAIAGAAVVVIAAGIIARGPSIGVDMRYRYNEIKCVRAGVNPFDIWNGTATLSNYCRFDACPPSGEPVHAYPPWEYTLAMPLTFLPQRTAGEIMGCLILLFAGIVAVWCYRYGYTATDTWQGGLFCAATALLTGLPIHEEFRSQNYYLLCTAATIGLAISLNRGRQVLGGICWALMMIKPQYGTLFAIPILWRRQFITFAVAVVLCLAASVPPALMTHTPLPDIILQAGRAGSEYFIRSGLIPAMIFQPISTRLPGFPAVFSAILGIGICLWLTWLMRRRRNWFEFVLPTVFCTTIWTYCLMYGQVPYALLICFAAERLWRAAPGRETFLRALAIVSLVNGLVMYLPFPLHSGNWIASHLAPGADPVTLQRLSRLADLPFFAFSYLAHYVTLVWLVVVARRAARTAPEEAIP